MPKKQQRNAFYFFMKELEPQLRREGRVFPNGMADVVPIAHPRYQQLSQKEKERFEKMAKDAKAQLRGKAGDIYRRDVTGNIIAHRKDPYTELEKRRMNERKDMIKDWPAGEELKTVPFHFIDFQYLCKTEDGDYLPCEIAVIEYTIEKGITKVLHRFIEPGRIPTGYRFTCIQNSEDTHQIPVEGFEKADKNYRGLWIQLENFINPQGDLEEHPPLYCLGAKDNYKVVEYCLQWIHGRACLGEPNRIRKIYEIESLFQAMHAHIGNQVSKSSSINALTSNEWDYEPNTRCDYHEEKEVKDCSLGIIKRYSYAISDSLCQYYNVKLTANHIPIRKEIRSFTTLPPSAMPVCTKQESRLPPKSDMLFKPQPQVSRKPDIDDEDSEEDYQELRRPKIPDYAGMGGVSGPAWGGPMGGPAYNDSSTKQQPMGRGMSIASTNLTGMGVANAGAADFPPIGRGLGSVQGISPMGRGIGNLQSMALNMNSGNEVNERHASRSAPPKPSDAPAPPLSWQQQNSMPLQKPMGIGRGLMAFSPMAQGAPDEGEMAPLRRPGSAQAPLPGYSQARSPDEDLAPLRMPGQTVPLPVSQFQDLQVSAPKTPANDLMLNSGTGRGKGGILDCYMTKGVRPGVACGRGYTPPDWVFDETFGQVK